jgi:hypothetical protein
MSINNIKRLLLSLVIGLCAGTVFAPREDRVTFAPQQPRRRSIVASPVTQEALKPVSVVRAAPSLPKEKKERMTFGNKPQQVRRGK